MDLENNTSAAPIDPQLDMLNQDGTTDNMAYPFSTSFEPWNSMFESMGDFPQSTQDGGVMDSDFYSDSASSVSFGYDQDAQFLMSPTQKSPFNQDESPGNTSISTSLSEPGASTDTKPNTDTNIKPNTNANTKNNTSKATKSKKGHRRNRSETEKKEQVKQRNRVAASKCRQKKKVKVDELREMQTNLEAHNSDLHMEFQRLRQEIGQVKSDLINHSECHDPNIDRWVENEAKGYVQKLVQNEERQRMESFSHHDENMEAMQMQSYHGMSNMSSDDPYMGMN